MAGYSGTPLEKKLGVKDGEVVFLDHAPDGFELQVPTTDSLAGKVTITLTFHTSATALAARLPELIEHTEQAGMIWVCWPKQAAVKAGLVVADLTETKVREIGLAAGLVDVKVCAIDEVWSGLKFVRRVADRTEGNTRDMATDEGIHRHISDLVARERELRARLQAHEIDPEDERAELHELEVELDQCWDLLRQRDALRSNGDDPDAASLRPANEVEGYLG